MEPTQEFIQKIFDYHIDGYLIWKINPYRTNIQIGTRAGSVNKTSNRGVININLKQYRSSRIIFLWHKGYLPKIVDHKDRDKLNDRIENLRPATASQNSKNSTSAKNSTSKYLGVSWHTKYQKWRSSIRVDGVGVYLGSFVLETNAALAYNNAAIKYHGEFANLNIISSPVA